MGDLLAYGARRSLRPGEALGIRVSAPGLERFRAQVVRLRAPATGGPPHMTDLRADPVDCPANATYPARVQPLRPGSFVEVAGWGAEGALTLALRVCPTLTAGGDRALVSTLAADGSAGLALVLDAEGGLVLRLGTPAGPADWATGLRLARDRWQGVAITLDPSAGRAEAAVVRPPGHRMEAAGTRRAAAPLPAPLRPARGPLRIGAALGEGGGARWAFNGRIERPRWIVGARDAAEAAALAPDAPCPWPAEGDWDFARGIATEQAEDVSGRARHGWLRQMPARGVAGSLWDGSELDWRARPAHYGAIHFHDDDLIDAGWTDDFVVPTGADWPSGAYAVHLTGAEGAAFWVPFFLRPAGAPTAAAVFLVPTCTYSAYANLRVRVTGQWNELIHGRLTVLDRTDLLMLRHPGIGLSTYDSHSDGSEVLYSGLDRPVTNFRPEGRIYKFCQDLLILAWAEAAGFALDVLTDEDLHAEGRSALAGYRTLVTASHPEYWTTPMLDALEGWLRRGGRMMYLGGNGFFWRTAYHPTRPGVVEVRRVGLERIWAATPGESVFSTVPEPGGTWAHAGRPPDLVAGVGFITQGFDACAHYRKRPGAADPRAAFVFEGVPEALIGDFGGLMGGAAGYEIDRHSARLGAPAHALVLASSEGHSNLYDLMVGSIVDVLPVTDPDAPEPLRADMVFFETPGGGAVFSVGSIAWSGSLPWNGWDNNVARITANVLRRFNDPAPFAMPEG